MSREPGGGNLVENKHTAGPSGTHHRVALPAMPADGQNDASTHSWHRGFRASHTFLPWSIRRRLNVPRSDGGTMSFNSCSTLTGSVCVVRPRRTARRPTWVSTGRPG